MSLRVLIMAGGTGGHVFPALAVAEELTKSSAEISWLGTQRGIESRLVAEAGYPLYFMDVQGLRGNGLAGWLMAPFSLIKALVEALRLIKQVKPDVVMGMGGFAAGPGGVAAWLKRKPLIIHEQNAIPGLTNRLLSRIAATVLEAFPHSFPSARKAVWIGNPVRQTIEDLPLPAERFAQRTGSMHLLVLGGSLGAKSLNNKVPEALSKIDPADRPVVRHQCGQRHISECKQAYSDVQVTAEVTDFIADMATVYGWADLVICRAGALTIAELAAAGVASLLVPYPYAVDDHQTANAAMLVDVGAAILIADSDLSAEWLAQTIQRLMKDRQKLTDMATAAHLVGKRGSGRMIADACLELVDE